MLTGKGELRIGIDDHVEILSGFTTKVYGILTVQLASAAVVAYPFVMGPSVKAWVKHDSSHLVVFATVLNIVLLCAMMCPCGLLVGGLTIYAMMTETDFAGMGVYRIAAVLDLMIFGIYVVRSRLPSRARSTAAFGA